MSFTGSPPPASEADCRLQPVDRKSEEIHMSEMSPSRGMRATAAGPQQQGSVGCYPLLSVVTKIDPEDVRVFLGERKGTGLL